MANFSKAVYIAIPISLLLVCSNIQNYMASTPTTLKNLPLLRTQCYVANLVDIFQSSPYLTSQWHSTSWVFLSSWYSLLPWFLRYHIPWLTSFLSGIILLWWFLLFYVTFKCWGFHRPKCIFLLTSHLSQGSLTHDHGTNCYTYTNDFHFLSPPQTTFLSSWPRYPTVMHHPPI